MRRLLPRLGYCLPASVLVLTGLLLFPSAGQDDAHISCWPAYTLSHQGQMVNYNGDRVEQSSSLLLVLLLAALHSVTGVNVITLAKLVSIVAGVATLVALSTLVARVTTPTTGFWAASIAALSTPIVYWSFSGMETTLVSLTSLCMLVAAADHLAAQPHASPAKLALALAAFVMVRPEAPLLLAVTIGAALAIAAAAGRWLPSEWASARRAALLIVLSAAICAALFVFRSMYFGDAWPQPVTAKFSGASWRYVLIGLHYVKGHAWNPGFATASVTVALAVGLLVTMAGQVRKATLNPYILLSAVFACCSLAFVITSGADWMPRGRFLAHFLPVSIAFIPFAVREWTSQKWTLPLVAVTIMVLEAAATLAFARTDSMSFPLWAEVNSASIHGRDSFSWFERHSRINVRDLALIDALDAVVGRIAGEKHGPVVVMSGQMGMVSYHIARRHFGRVRFVDRHGLVERSLTDCLSRDHVPRDNGGLVISAARYLTLVDELPGCDLPVPDVIYDIGTWSSSRLAASGYSVVYEQTGTISSVGTSLPGGAVLADAFIALHDSRPSSSRSPAITGEVSR